MNDRCRIVLSYDVRRCILEKTFIEMCDAGDIAAIILYDSLYEQDQSCLLKQAEILIPIIQGAQIAAICAHDVSLASALNADGVYLEDKKQLFSYPPLSHSVDAETDTHAMMVGYGDFRDRHQALEIGERQPDYVVFGRLGFDKKPSPHRRNIALASWWARMIEIPAIVQLGSDLSGLSDSVASGAEFLLLEEAIFSQKNVPDMITIVNDLLGDHVIGDRG